MEESGKAAYWLNCLKEPTKTIEEFPELARGTLVDTIAATETAMHGLQVGPFGDNSG